MLYVLLAKGKDKGLLYHQSKPFPVSVMSAQQPNDGAIYPVLRIDAASIDGDEQLGSKTKFWFRHADEEWLFKEARATGSGPLDFVTGEDWAEKIAAELAALLDISAATVELAEYEGRRGSASRNFLTDPDFHLEHGNEVLAGKVSGYDPKKQQKQSDHTLENLITAVRSLFPEAEERRQALEKLASYLVLDALIGNTDRHHENWGLLWRNASEDQRIYAVAPSFDHASSLGRELSDRRCIEKLQTKQGVENYLRKGRGGIYLRPDDRRGASPLAVVEYAVTLYHDYFHPILARLSMHELEDIQELLDKIPSSHLSDSGRAFAKEMLAVAYHALIKLK